MADEHHVRFAQQGVDAWNSWRRKHPTILPDLSHTELGGIRLSEANLEGVDLSGARLKEADLSYCNLKGADLVGANFTKARLQYSNLKGTTLRGAVLVGANLYRAKGPGANFSEAQLTSASMQEALFSEATFTNAQLGEANLGDTDLSRTQLDGADLNKCVLNNANLEGADLTGANLRKASLIGAQLQATRFQKTLLEGVQIARACLSLTVFADVSLKAIEGLDEVRHLGPSTIGIDTLFRSEGTISETFLRKCGVPEIFITYHASLTTSPIQFYSCFISYSHKDEHFVERLHADLRARDVRCWFAPEDLKIGDRIRPRIDETIRVFDKLLLVLSENSIRSQWVEQEVETALNTERARAQTVLFPIRLDDRVLESDTGWPALLKNTRHIGDFTKWKDHESYQKAFAKLVRDLKLD